MENDKYEALIRHLEWAMHTDDETFDNKGRKLVEIYTEADAEEKELIDNVLIAVCGFSLKTLIKDVDVPSTV